MAKKSTNKSKSTKAKKRTYTTKKQKEAQKAIIKDEIILIITFVLSILLLLSNFDLSGKVGKVINNITFGLFGFLGYLMPFVLFWLVVFLIANRGNMLAYRKALSFTVLFITFTALIQLVGSKHAIDTIGQYYKDSSTKKSGGGIIGGAIVNLIHPLFGTVGSYVIIIGIILICTLLLTGKALFVYLGKKGRNTFNEYKEEKAKDPNKSSKKTKIKEENNKPRTFLLKDTLKGLSSKKDKVDNDISISEDISVSEEKSGQKAFAMEEIQTTGNIDNDNDIDIAIHRSEPYIEEPKAVDNIFDSATSKDSKASTSSQEKIGKADIEEIKIDQSIDEEKEYVFPLASSLARPRKKTKGVSDKMLKDTALKLQETLESFGVGITVTNISCGPAVTRYELQPEQGVKVSKITSLADDIKLNLAASEIRIEAPIPGKAAVGIEVPNNENSIVSFREMIESTEFANNSSKLAFTAGKDIAGKNVIADIAKMPHLLIAGATGSGKSVCINTIIMSILFNAKPSEVRLIMIDPKVVELSGYNGIPHLLLPVVTDPKKAASALNWAVNEMTERYKKFADLGVRDLEGYNKKVKMDSSIDEKYEKLPQILIIVDELSDLMMVASNEVEDAICRLAQMARAAGLHLIIATQRPSVNVITGVIKANIPSRIAFAVSSAVDSRTIIDSSGAEKLLGKGDMLFYPSGSSKPIRVQGAFISDKEISKVVEFVTKNNGEATYDKEIEKEIVSMQTQKPGVNADYLERDEYFAEAGRYIIEKDKASIGMLQRVFRIGFNRAARIMDQLHQAGAVGPEEGTKPREIIMNADEFEQYLDV